MVKEFMGEKRTGKMIALGEANLEVLRGIEQWCKHLKAEQMSAGMLAAMSGLPIGSFRFTCQHADDTPGAMNLTWISRDFLDHNCRDCPHHEPNGDPTWGRDVLTQVDTARATRAHREREMQAAVAELRRQCRSQAGHGRSANNLTECQILNWAEQIFDEDPGTSSTAASNLTDAVRVAPDLFGEAVVGALCKAGSSNAFHASSLSILAQLADRRTDLAAILTGTAVAAIEARVGLEHACDILCKTRPEWTGEERGPILKQVVAQRNHIRPIGGWPTRDPRCELIDIAPKYALSDGFVAQEYDRDEAAVIAVLKDALCSDDPDRRINICGVVSGLMALRPQVAVVLAAEVATALELSDNEYGESADHAECETLAQAFLIDPEAIDRILTSRIGSRLAPVQEALIGVYNHVFRTKILADDEHQNGENDHRDGFAIEVTLRRVLQLIQDDRLDLDPLLEAVRAIRSASWNHPESLVNHYPLLLHMMAAWANQPDARPAPTALLLPGDEPKPAVLVAMEHQSRNTRWQHIKQELGKGLSELVKSHPHRIADALLGAFSSLHSGTQASFKAEVVQLLGVLGLQYELLPRVLPPLWSALMDSSSSLIRARGIEAIGECFSRASEGPPSDIVSILVLHLNDTYVIVHRAAVRVVGDNPDWLTEEQAVEALQRLENLLVCYKSDQPFELVSIADALLAVSRQVPRARTWVVNRIVSLLPSGEDLLDRQLIERLTRAIRPAEPAGLTVARSVLEWVGRAGSDEEDFRDEMKDAFSWLHALPPKSFRDVRNLAVEQARETASDFRLAAYFASLFAAHEDYGGESEVLSLARTKMPAGRRFEQVANAIERLMRAAGRNASRPERGDD